MFSGVFNAIQKIKHCKDLWNLIRYDTSMAHVIIKISIRLNSLLTSVIEPLYYVGLSISQVLLDKLKKIMYNAYNVYL